MNIQYTRWQDFPTPNVVSNQSQVSVVTDLSSLTNVVHGPVFSTLEVQVFRSDQSTLLLDTGPLRIADILNREFLVMTNNNQLELWLAPYITGNTNVSSFGNSDPSLTNKQIVATNVIAGDTFFVVKYLYQDNQDVRNPLPYLNVVGGSFPMGQGFSLGDLGAICIDAGRVSEQMLDVYGQPYANTVQQMLTNASFQPRAEDGDGARAYLVGMTYWAGCDEFDVFNQSIHKVMRPSVMKIGLSKIQYGIDPYQPVDVRQRLGVAGDP